jgi:hypothetical protein
MQRNDPASLLGVQQRALLPLQRLPHSEGKLVKKTFTLEFPFKVDEPTMNGRIYPRAVMEKALAEKAQPASNRQMFGELDTDCQRVRLEHTSHLITSLRLENGVIEGEVEPLPTEKGKVLAALHESKIPLMLNPVGRGDVDEETGIISNYTIDFINIASNRDG